jgi:hypothetical protein
LTFGAAILAGLGGAFICPVLASVPSTFSPPHPAIKQNNAPSKIVLTQSLKDFISNTSVDSDLFDWE